MGENLVLGLFTLWSIAFFVCYIILPIIFLVKEDGSLKGMWPIYAPIILISVAIFLGSIIKTII